MTKLSNKGQTLALFVIFIPFMILLGVWVIDMSNMKYEENKLCELSKMLAVYGVNHYDNNPNDDIIKMITLNDKDIKKYNINIDDDSITVKVLLEKQIDGILGNIVGYDKYNAKCEMKAHIENDRLTIMEGKK